MILVLNIYPCLPALLAGQYRGDLSLACAGESIVPVLEGYSFS